MTIHDTIMVIMRDGIERSVSELANMLKNEYPTYTRDGLRGKIATACNKAIKYGFLKKRIVAAERNKQYFQIPDAQPSKYPDWPDSVCPMTVKNVEKYKISKSEEKRFCSDASGGCSPICGEQFYEKFGKRAVI